MRDFLASRDITLPEGQPDDPPAAETVNGLGNRKNDLLQSIIAERGVSAVPRLGALSRGRTGGRPQIAVVTSSANGEAVLDAAGLTAYVQPASTASTITERDLRGKPAPDSFLAGAEALGVAPAEAAVFEDALAGVQAGRAGGSATSSASTGPIRPTRCETHGADVVVDDLAELLENRHDHDATRLPGLARGSCAGAASTWTRCGNRIDLRPVQRPHRAARHLRGG